MTFSIAGRFIGREYPCYLIAEIGVHHDNDPVKAKELIAAAVEAGADAVKFQAYRADHLVTRDSPPYWQTSYSTQWEYFKATEAPKNLNFYADTAAYAATRGVHFLLTAFDAWLVEELNLLVPAWKIASGDITYDSLIRCIASKGKPIVLSTGASTLEEINHAMRIIHNADPDVRVALLHCVLAYPTYAKDANLLAIPTIARYFGHRALIGWSDHVVDRNVVPFAYAVGAHIIEKHFALDREHGMDAYHSWTPETLAQDRKAVDELWPMLGTGEKDIQECERPAWRYARRAKHKQDDGSLRVLRPAF